MKKEPRTKVVFRKWPDGNIIALFPQIASDVFGYSCQSYEHVGQHGGADYSGVVQRTTPAKPHEFSDLKQELERRGYDLWVVERASYRDYVMRVNSAKG
jgi:hypothetical protein